MKFMNYNVEDVFGRDILQKLETVMQVGALIRDDREFVRMECKSDQMSGMLFVCAEFVELQSSSVRQQSCLCPGRWRQEAHRSPR